MATQAAKDLKQKIDTAFAHLTAQLAGMDPYLERSDAPGEWTAREVLSHLLAAPGWNPVSVLATFATEDLPVIEIDPGNHYLDDPRRRMSLTDYVKALDEQRQSVAAYLDTLSEPDLGRKARIPLFKSIMGTDEIPVPVFVGALFSYHWNDHAGQLAKIRKAVGLPDAR